MSNFEPSLTIKYQWGQSSAGLDLDVLGESIVGFNNLIKDLGHVLKLKGEISSKARVAKDGSIIFEIYTSVATAIHTFPFENVQAFHDFLSFTGQHIVADATETAFQVHEDLKALYAKYPLDAALLGLALAGLIRWASKQKKTVTFQDENGKYIPTKYAPKLRRLVTKKKAFKKALKPFVEGQVSSIEIRPAKQSAMVAIITEENFDTYLSEDEKILPEYENGKKYRFAGTIVGLESAKGDYMKFKALGLSQTEHSLLVAYPEVSLNTEDYVDYYKKPVHIQATVMRKSVYQKPQLAVSEVELMQEPML